MDCWWAGAAYVGTRVGRATRAGLWLSAAASIALCASCNYGEVVVVQPAAAGHGPLTLSIQVDPEDSAVARELGWTRGIPGAEVTISPADADTAKGPPVAALESDNAGGVSIGDLPDGHYIVEVTRLLAPAETAKLTAPGDVVGFMAYAVVERVEDILLVPGSHRRSIVISEWAFEPEWERNPLQMYFYGGFLELTNNSDTTIYLDGLVVGDGYAKDSDLRPGWCAASEFVTTDPDGVWARFLDSVPGTGRDHPLAPGASVVIATDGIDHSGIVPGGLDLSHADFEFIGDADVDNPGVPNMVDLTVKYWAYMPHGLVSGYFTHLVVISFVALPLDTASLLHTPTNDYVRIPRGRLLDVVASRAAYIFEWPECPDIVHPNFDRQPARFKVDSRLLPEALSGHRKVALTRSDGRKILQDTRSGMADFFRGPRTPGRLP
jgi:hypothetical protein